MWEILSFAATVASECLGGLVRPHCGYVFCTDRKVSQLDGELEQLVNTEEMVRRSVEEARDDTKPIFPFVDKWLEDEQIVADKARSVLDGRAQKTCFCGWLPNPKARYCLGKDASKTVEEIQKLIARRNTWEKVYYENPPRGLVGGAADLNSSAADGGDIITGSRASIFHDIMEALGDDKLKVIGVYGPGGVGKTTLLKEVEKKLGKEKKPFQMIVKAEVSQTPDLENIRGQIADSLGLDLMHKQTPQGRRDLLFQRLQRDMNEKVLIILDNLLVEVDLTEIGIPLGEKSKGCKLLLTSRYNNVLLEKMRADRTFHLKGLEDVEAVRLFEKTVGDRLKDEGDLKPIAAQVATKLAGLPLLIISIATALKNSDVGAWRDASKKIDVKEMETIVQLSYDHLMGDDSKSLFLLCGLIGGSIPVETLLVLGMGMGLIERRTIPDSRDRLDTMLSELRSACLLLDGGDDKENVTILDLYREAVVSTPFRDRNSLIIYDNCGTWPKEKLDECPACLVDVGNDRFVELMPHRFPQAKILMLSEKNDMGDHSKKYFKDMKELRALCLCSRSITSLPSPIETLGNLRSLIINCRLEDVAILGKLKALQFLSFAGSAISKLPKEIGDLTNLKLLNLSNCYELAIIEPGVLKGLTNLEELLMRGSFDRWMGNDEVPSESRNAKLAELKNLTRLTALEISIRDPTVLLEAGDLPFGNLIRFWINIGNVYGREFQGLRTMKLKLEGCDGILSKEWIQKTLHKTQHLHLDGLREFKKSPHELCIRGFPQLKHLDIDNSPSIEYIASSSNGLLLTAFTKLESLFVGNLINLEKMWNGPLAPDCFNKLKAVGIVKCHRLKNLGFLSEMQRLVHLEEIEVRDCESLQAIITDDGGKVEVAADDRVGLPNVRRLDLSCLPNMLSFCAGADGAPIQVSFPRLESLWMDGLLDLAKMFYSQPQLQYTSLKSIKIRDFASSSSSILKSDWVLKLPNLEYLEISYCQSTKVVFDLEELNVMGHVEILSQLTKLILWKLPNLQHVWKHDVKLQGLSAFRNLKELDVRYTRLGFLFTVSVAKCLREIRDIRVADCPNMEAMIVDEEGKDEGTDDIIEFPKLERLRIWNCPTKKFSSCPSGKKELVTTILDLHSDSFFDQKVKLPNITSLEIIGAPCTELWNNQISDESFCKLEFLRLVDCDNLHCIFPSNVWKRLQRHLDILQVESCCSIEIIYEGDDTVMKSGKLTRLILRDLQNLRHIWRFDGLPNVPFPSLRFIEVQSCPRLRMLFPTFMPDFLGQIAELVVESCEDMELIASHEECEEATGTAITFSKLTALRLFKLPKFKSFLPETYSVEFPSLQVLNRVSCGTEPDQVLGDWGSYKRREECEFIFNQKSLEIGLFDLEKIQCPSQNTNLKFILIQDFDFASSASSILKSDWILKLPNLESLEIKSCQSTKVVFDLEELKDTGHVEILSWLTELTLWKLPNLQQLWKHDVKLQRLSVFPNLKELEVRETGLAFLFPVSAAQCLREIRDITVFNCRNMEAVIVDEGARDGGIDDIIEFPKLKRLCISKCPMKKFFSCRSGRKELVTSTLDSQDAYSDSFFDRKVAFPRLETVEISGLDNLGFMFFPSMVKSLAQLRKLRVSDCMKMEAVITEEEGWGMEALETLEFPMLTDLHLQHLQSLTCFSRAKRSREAQSQDRFKSPLTALFSREVAFPSLEALHISGMGYIKMICDNHLLLSSTRSFQHLKTLYVSHCDELSNLFTPIIAGNLVELTRLRISNCKMLTEVISDEGSKEGSVVAVKRLKYMELKELIGLTCFSSARYTLMFPLLEDVIATGCLNMKFFSVAPIRAPKLKRVEGLTGTWFWNGNIRHPMQNASIEMTIVDGVEFMHLSGSSGITEKWHNKLLPIKSYCQVKSLVVDNCPLFINVIPSGLMFVLDKTNALQVQDCESVEEIFNLEGLEATESTRVLPRLWCLNLVNLPKLRQLWDKDLQGALCFRSLSYLTLYKCRNLKHAFAPSMTQCLPSLQWMEIKECDQMEGVIAEEKGESSAVKKITFPVLRSMELERLPRLTSFLSGTNHILEFAILKELTIIHCPKIILSTWQSFMKIDRRISSPFPLQEVFPRVKTMVLSNLAHSSKIRVHHSQRSREVEALEKLQVEFCVIKETGLPSAT